MITFSCHCGHRLSVPDDQAGGQIQCPACKNLADIPNLSDLGHIEEDGTYKLDEAPAAEEPGRFEQLQHTFKSDRKDDQGEEIDLRPTMEDIQESGAEDVPKEMADQTRPGPPRYDPETGELIRPMDVTPPFARIAAPGDGQEATINYESQVEEPHVRPAAMLLRLFTLGNAAVMFFLFLLHVMGAFSAYYPCVAAGLIPFLFAPLLVAHYGNTIDEVGRQESDDLPRPLRDLQWGEDVWSPFANMTSALLICYAPSLIFVVQGSLPPLDMLLVASLAAVGTLLLPAVLITTNTSGSILNLRPDRIMGVIGAIGLRYFVAVLVLVIPLGIYAWLVAGPLLISAGWLPLRPTAAKVLESRVAFFVLCALAVYFGNYAMWYLGALYRDYREQFPWVLQRYVTAPRERRHRRQNADSSAPNRKPIRYQ
jgi:hypothetical protein